MDNQAGKKAVRVLQVTIGDGSYGGVASFLYSYYSHIDHSRVHFDFLYCGENSLESKQNTEVLQGTQITAFHILKTNNNGIKEYVKLLRELRSFFRKNQYDIVHINTSNVYVNACVTFSAHRNAVCIAHSHNTKYTIEHSDRLKRWIKQIVKLPCRNYILKYDTLCFACSKAAGANLYGEKILQSDKFRVINNAVDTEKYKFNLQIREKYQLKNKIVFGHVGRLTEQKNPEFLLDVFAEIHKRNPDTVLWMIGEGELQGEIEKRIELLKLSGCVKLWGRRDDIPVLMQAMDIFLFPSLYEGLSIVMIEAQASGLPIYASDSISPEHKITDLVSFLPLREGPVRWAEKICSELDRIPIRRDMSQEIKAAGYDIHQAAKCLEQFYVELIK